MLRVDIFDENGLQQADGVTPTHAPGGTPLAREYARVPLCGVCLPSAKEPRGETYKHRSYRPARPCSQPKPEKSEVDGFNGNNMAEQNFYRILLAPSVEP